MVAGGYGVAPFVLLSEQLRQIGRSSRLFYGGRAKRDLPLYAALTEQGLSPLPVTEDGSLGQQGLVTAPLTSYLDAHPSPAMLYACGPDAMLHAVATLAKRRGIKAQVSLDPWMGCGVGTCLGCVVWIKRPNEPRPRYRCACTEGPVFDAETVVWPGDSP